MHGETVKFTNKCIHCTNTINCSVCLTLICKLITFNFESAWDYTVGQDSSVGIATRYGLDGPEIESRWGRDFPHPSRPALGSPSLLYNGYRVFPGGKAAGAWRWPPIPSSAEVKERLELYLCSPCGTSWPVLGWSLPETCSNVYLEL